MIYTQQFNIHDFKFGGGAKERVDALSYHQKCKLQQFIEDCFADKMPSDEDINSFVWFECDEFLTEIGWEP